MELISTEVSYSTIKPKIKKGAEINSAPDWFLLVWGAHQGAPVQSVYTSHSKSDAFIQN
jgi:hypothetical protein